MTHHTDLQGADDLVAEFVGQLEQVLVELRMPHSQAHGFAHSEQARNVLRELIAATRRNDPMQRAVRQLAGAVGERAKAVLMLALLRTVQRNCLRAPEDRTPLPLPLGVATPVPSGDEEDVKTLPPAAPVNAIEDYASSAAPTRPVKPVQGPWLDSTRKGKRR